MLTLYGRKPVLEALQLQDLAPYKLHLAETNKPAGILDEIIALASQKGAEIQRHSRESLSRISKNKKQDQGVALDISPPRFKTDEQFLKEHENASYDMIALDRVTNPQNLGMIIRSVVASPIKGLLLPNRGCANLDSLVIKAGAGTLFKAPIVRCDSLSQSIETFKKNGAQIIGLESSSSVEINELNHANTETGNIQRIFVLGNETDGVSDEIRALCDQSIKIPMCNGIESLNVAVTASLIAFRGVF